MTRQLVFPRPRIAVSSCLLGQPVRYDGEHKRHAWLNDRLAKCVDLMPICPELAIGLGVPRPPIRLVGDLAQTRVLGVERPDQDFTQALAEHATRVAPELAGVAGYIFTSKSPSCGLVDTKIHDAAGEVIGLGAGHFAAGIARVWPELPLIDDRRMDEPRARDHFLVQVFTRARWLAAAGSGWTAKALLDFHRRHKYLLMAHSQAAYRDMGRLLANLKSADLEGLSRDYAARLVRALSRPVGAANHVNVLEHLAGYWKKDDLGEQRQRFAVELQALLKQQVPLLEPLCRLRGWSRSHPKHYLTDQAYLWPYPDALRRDGQAQYPDSP